jgi:general secretion pathway protein G
MAQVWIPFRFVNSERRPGTGVTTPRVILNTPGRRGGLLVVLVISLVVTTITLGTAVPAARNYVRQEKEAELRFVLGEFRRAIRKFQETNGRAPETISELRRDGNGVPFLRRVYTDPFTGKEDWVMEVLDGKTWVRSACEEKSLAGVPYRDFR